MRRIFVVFLVLVLVLVLFSSCGTSASPEEMKEKISSHVTLPAGVWYESGAEIWEAACLPDALMPVFFGDGVPSFPWVLYLGTGDDAIAEILYAVCDTEKEAAHLATVLSARLAELKRVSEELFCESLSDAAVLRRGKTVLYTATPANGEVQKMYR